jgi:hypothetical protein
LPFRWLVACLILITCETACQRGCLSRWMEEHAFERAGGSGAKPPGFVQLGSVDCPDGLARCTSGVVEVSRLSSHPEPCSGSREACECPWDRLSPCGQGCVAEDVEMVLPREQAVAQLCAPAPTDRIAELVPTALGMEGGVECGEERFVCTRSVVLSCSPTSGAQVVARCIKGCAVEGLTLDEDELTEDAARMLLCRR